MTIGENGIIIVRDDPKRVREVRPEETGEEETEARAYLNVKKKKKRNCYLIQWMTSMKSSSQAPPSDPIGQEETCRSRISQNLMPSSSSTRRLSTKGSRREQRAPSIKYSSVRRAGSRE